MDERRTGEDQDRQRGESEAIPIVTVSAVVTLNRSTWARTRGSCARSQSSCATITATIVTVSETRQTAARSPPAEGS